MNTTLTKREQARADKDKAIAYLLNDYLTGDNPRVYTILRRVSSSGMSRSISLCVADDKGQILNITYLVAKALGEKLVEVNGSNAIRVNGCGMDMGFHLVYTLSSVLYAGEDRAGYKLKHYWL